MKIVLALLLMFSVLADFSVASYDMASCESACAEASVCADDHLAGHDSDHGADSNSGHGCHNHAGHSHVAIINASINDLNSNVSALSVKFPKHKSNNLSLFLNEISRPPIS